MSTTVGCKQFPVDVTDKPEDLNTHTQIQSISGLLEFIIG